MNRKYLNYFLMIFSIAVCTVLPGCSQQSSHQQKIEDYVKEIRARKAPPVEPLPKFEAHESFRYSASKLRSPFSPPEVKVVNSNLKPDVSRSKEELEAYSLDALHMVGTITKGNQTWVLILAPDHIVYRARVGSYLGQNYGRISKIDNDKVDIIETIPDDLGGWKKRDASLTLNK